MMLIDGVPYCQCGEGMINTVSRGLICTEHGVTGKVTQNDN